MPVQPVLPRQQAVERIEQVVVGAGADLDDDHTGCGVGDEHRQQAVLGTDVGQEGGTCRGQVRQPPGRPRTDREQTRLYGKMLRSASRMRPSPPIAGADSYRMGSPSTSVVAPHWSSPTLVL